MNITPLTSMVPAALLAQIPSVIEKFQINTPLRLSHFLAQCAHESANFKTVRENLNYSVDGLLNIFPRYFKSRDEAAEYARQPERIANKVYASRIGNGPENSGDGWRFRGRGYIQLTGRANYKAFDRVVPENILTEPDLVATKYPLLSAAWFWNSRNLNSIADIGSSTTVVTRVTQKVNGGRNGLADRINKFNKYYSLLNV